MMGALIAACNSAQPILETTVTIRGNEAAVMLNPSFYGVFFEEINHAGEGGLFAEMVRNWNFAEPSTEAEPIPGWKSILPAAGSLELSKTVEGFGESNRNKVQVISNAKGAGISNAAFYGFGLKKGESYELTLESEGDTDVSVEVVDEGGRSCLQFKKLKSGRVRARAKATEGCEKGTLRLTLDEPGTVGFLSVSLMPVARIAGTHLRRDLGDHVQSLMPKFLRFPGGCYVEGGDALTNAFRWKTSIGDPALRPGHMNANWGYWSTDGLGYHEYLVWCEKLKAEPMYVINCGMSHKELTPMGDLGPWVQDALDAIEYANGPVTSKWGAIRAANGHPQPFKLKYLEIGNENGMWSGFGGVLADYEPRYRAFYDAVKAKFPEIICISNTRGKFKADLVDDHYYNSPDWFWANAGLYDNADRSGPKVYVGEYAVTSNCGNGNLRAALAEAAFLIGLERNGDHVQLASYAPLFVHAEDRRWNPDAIVFNSLQSYGTPSYWLQTMYAANQPERVFKTDYAEVRKEAGPGSVGLGAWRTSVEYKDAVLTSGAKTIKLDATRSRTAIGQLDFRADGGTFTSTSRNDPDAFFFDNPDLKILKNYTFEVKARKTGGDEGFLILVRAQDPQNFLWVNLGGWGNTAHNIEKASGGGQAPIARGVVGKIETGRWYDIRVECNDSDIKCFLDGKEVLTAIDRAAPTFIAGAGLMAKNVLAVKLINAGDGPLLVNLDLKGWEANEESRLTTMMADSLDSENSFAQPRAIVPKTTSVKLSPTRPQIMIPARSANVLRLTVRPK